MTVLFCIYDSSFDIYDTSWQKKKAFKNSSVALPRFVVVKCFNLRCASFVLSHYTQRHHTTYSGAVALGFQQLLLPRFLCLSGVGAQQIRLTIARRHDEFNVTLAVLDGRALQG